MSDKKPKGAKTAYACFVQVIRDEHKKKHPGEEVNFTEMSKKCSEKWKQMSDSEKKRFKDIAAKDKERFNKEMESYVPTTGRRKRKAKDPNKPKRAKTAFMIFSDEKRGLVREENPGWSIVEVAKELGRMWQGLDDKSKYEALAKMAKEQYAKDMEAYNNGVKISKKSASDHANGKHDDDEEDDEDEEEEND